MHMYVRLLANKPPACAARTEAGDVSDYVLT